MADSLKRNFLLSIIAAWFPLAIAITLLSGAIYFIGQQVYRQSGYDPQIQIAEDLSNALGQGQLPETLINTNNSVSVDQSLADFVIVYNQDGNVLLSTGKLKDQTPALPNGVLAYVNSRGEDKFTWQPDNNVRLATVVTKVPNSQARYVLVARSLREVERRTMMLLLQVGIAWFATMVSSFVGVVICMTVLRMRN